MPIFHLNKKWLRRITQSRYSVAIGLGLGCWLILTGPILSHSPPKSATKANKEGRKQSSTVDSLFTQNNLTAAQALGWVEDSSCHNLCGGYYREPTIVLTTPHPETFKKEATHVTSTGPTQFRLDGVSVLQQNVKVAQPGRLTTADIAKIYRDNLKQKFTKIELTGHVHFAEYEKLVVGEHAELDLQNHSARIEHAFYHLVRKTPQGWLLQAWGKAAYVYRDANNVFHVEQGTYSTCPPKQPSWYLKAKDLTFDQKKQVAKAHNVKIVFKHIPIFYSPYLSFSLDKTRKSGVLPPTISYSSKNGLDITAPIYLNLAPNYDTTLYPELITARGVRLSDDYRYLTAAGSGKVEVSFLPDDKRYGQFLQQNSLTGNNNRTAFSLDSHSQFDSNWSLNLKSNYVSDSYYLQDFSLSQDIVTANQLLNQADIDYVGEHWQFTGLVQAYQTLHPINQTVQDQYQRLPEFNWTGQYPNIYSHTDFNVDMQFVNFNITPTMAAQFQTGQRYHIRPSVSLPFSNSFAYFTPQVYLDYTHYDVNNQVNNQANNLNRGIPLVDINTGMYFERPLAWRHSQLTQTLEPQFFYLWVPYQNQVAYPDFDTILLPFTYAQLFSLNQYSGFDRIQNANQLSVGLTTRTIRQQDGSQLLSASIGQIYYFTKPQVPLPGVNLNQNQLSPIVAQLSYYPSIYWTFTGNYAYDPIAHHTNNAALDATYSREGKYIADLGYDFVYTNGSGYNNYNRFRLGTTWPIHTHWSGLGYWYYNISQHYPDGYYAGLQYDSCCWAMRFIVDRNEFNVDSTTTIAGRTQYYFQFQLKGLGNIGNSNPDNLLKTTLPGYQNIFQ